ncbi:hypothetical protein NDU88_007981 [Pleurodeles waltl]|uniref:Uncharacterized protein n=1 Tax=Pleurodeles waltl TaxID=8319 RepID=A0AAV7NUM2_PLEWA|nr:hypothetical protein NDU88_007981 [Pleurodeles waltl]
MEQRAGTQQTGRRRQENRFVEEVRRDAEKKKVGDALAEVSRDAEKGKVRDHGGGGGQRREEGERRQRERDGDNRGNWGRMAGNTTLELASRRMRGETVRRSQPRSRRNVA